MAMIKLKYKTPAGDGEASVVAYTARPGEGVNGPYILDFFSDKEKTTLCGGASRVTEFSEG